MFNILVKTLTDLLISWSLSSAVGSFLVGRGQEMDNRPVELWFLGLNDITLVGRATIYYISKLSIDLIRRYIVLYFLPKTPHLLPTK